MLSCSEGKTRLIASALLVLQSLHCPISIKMTVLNWFSWAQLITNLGPDFAPSRVNAVASGGIIGQEPDRHRRQCDCSGGSPVPGDCSLLCTAFSRVDAEKRTARFVAVTLSRFTLCRLCEREAALHLRRLR